MLGLSRLLALLVSAATLVAAIGSAHASLPVLAYVGGAFILTAFGVAFLWTRPLLAAALGWMWITAAFAAGAINAGSVDTAGAPAFFGLSSGDSAALVVAAAAVVAAIGGILAVRNAIARVVIVLLALYVAVPTATSIGHGGLPAAFSSAPFAQTRGTYAGAEVILPLAALVAIVLAVVFVVQKRGTRSALALVTAVAVLLAAHVGAYTAGTAGLPTLTVFEQSGLGGVASPISESPQAVADQLERVGSAIKPEDFILAELAKKLPSAEAAFAYVRDNIRFESYDGILRGADGTFYARAGNATDRAMLLAAIMENKKIPVHLVTGQLPAPLAERLYQRIFEPAANSAAPPKSDSSGANALQDRIFARARRDFNVILAALGGAAPAMTAVSHDDLIKEIEQHAWVQAQVNGKWEDLDPSFADSTAGHAYTSVDQSYNAPPQPLMQQVTIRVTTETLQSGALTKQTVLETTVPAYLLDDARVYLAHTPPTFGKVFGNPDVWTPVLEISGDITGGKPINFGAGASPAGAPTANPLNQVVNAFGTPAPAATPNPNGPFFVAEWLEFEVATPDGHKDVTRRVLIDRAGAAWRHASTLDPSKLRGLPRNSNGLIAPQAVYNICFSAGKHDLLAFANSALTLAKGIIPAEDPQKPRFDEQAWPLAIRDLAWFIVSDHVLVPALNDTAGVRFYADSPRIFVWGFGPNESGKSTSLFLESDLRRDRLRGVTKDPSGLGTIAQHKLWFGALEGALEHELSVQPNTDPANPLVTTSSLLDSSGVVVAHPGETLSASDPETQARLQVALAGGDTLIVPKHVLAGGPSGWWQISQKNGDVRAVLGEDLDNGIFGPASGSSTPSFGKGVCVALCDEHYNPIKRPPKKSAGGGEIGEYAFTIIYISAEMVPVVKVIGAIVDITLIGVVAIWGNSVWQQWLNS